MADLRREPEWRQRADRHSKLIDPVLTVRPISRFEYTTRRPATAIDHALVFVTSGGEYDVYVPPHRPGRAEAATRRYTSVYEVDTGSHEVNLELELPSHDDTFSFKATADLTWRVSDAEAYVRGGERDVPRRLLRELQQLGRPVSRRFAIEDAPDAEAAVQQAVDACGFAGGIGLAVTCAVQLSLDDETAEHQRRKRALRYESELLDPEHELRLRKARLEYELEALSQRQQQELAAQKINFYQYHLQYGGVGAWALHLAQRPEDTQLVINNIQQDQLTFIQSQLELIGGDSLEDYQKAESMRQVRHAVDELVRRRSAPPDDRTALPTGTPAPADAQPTAEPPQDADRTGQAPYDGQAPGPHSGNPPEGAAPAGAYGGPTPMTPPAPSANGPATPSPFVPAQPTGPAVPSRPGARSGADDTDAGRG
jgi:hypothetical protein